MTKKERANPALLQASRKKRIAAGAGLEVSDLNKLLKQHRQMSDMMKKIGKKGGLGALKGMLGGQGAPSQAELAAAQEQIASGAMGGLAFCALPYTEPTIIPMFDILYYSL